MDDELRRFASSWVIKNPGYRYELLTFDAARTYVRERYMKRPDIVETYERIRYPILAVGYIRYLVLLADGGVYSDFDVACTKPIDDWIPAQYVKRTGMVVGLEYGSRDDELRADLNLRTQFRQQVLMSKPGHPLMQHVVDRITAVLQEFGGDEDTIHNDGERMYLTGPRIFTKAMLETLSINTRIEVSDLDITKLEGPKLIGDVLVLPVSASASGRDHFGSEPFGNDQQLVSYHSEHFSF